MDNQKYQQDLDAVGEFLFDPTAILMTCVCAHELTDPYFEEMLTDGDYAGAAIWFFFVWFLFVLNWAICSALTGIVPYKKMLGTRFERFIKPARYGIVLLGFSLLKMFMRISGVG